MYKSVPSAVLRAVGVDRKGRETLHDVPLSACRLVTYPPESQRDEHPPIQQPGGTPNLAAEMHSSVARRALAFRSMGTRIDDDGGDPTRFGQATEAQHVRS